MTHCVHGTPIDEHCPRCSEPLDLEWFDWLTLFLTILVALFFVHLGTR